MQISEDSLNDQLSAISTEHCPASPHKERLRAALRKQHSPSRQRTRRKTHLLVAIVVCTAVTGVSFAATVGVKNIRRWFIYYQVPQTQPDGAVTKEWHADEVVEIEGELSRTKVGKAIPPSRTYFESVTDDAGNTKIQATGPLGEKAPSVLRFHGFDDAGQPGVKMITGPEGPIRDQLLDESLEER